MEADISGAVGGHRTPLASGKYLLTPTAIYMVVFNVGTDKIYL